MIHKVVNKTSTDTCLSANELDQLIGDVPFIICGLGGGFGSCAAPEKHIYCSYYYHPFNNRKWESEDLDFAVSYSAWLENQSSSEADLYVEEYKKFCVAPDSLWIFSREKMSWIPPIPEPEEGKWIWDSASGSWMGVDSDAPTV